MHPALQALLATLVVELGVAWMLLPRLGSDRVAGLVAVASLNLLTHPAAVWLHGGRDLPWWSTEALVFVAEAAGAAGLLGLPVRRALLLSLCCNLPSAAAGWWW